MNTELISINDKDYEASLDRAGKIIKDGGLVAFPTETVYGLGGDALNKESSKKIYAAKGRPSDNPLIVHISKREDLYKIADDISEKAIKVMDMFWPGPVTVIFKKKEIVPLETTGGLNTVAVRMPNNKCALEFIEKAGGFIAAPSANTSGRPSPTKASHVFEDMNGKIDMIIDGGEAGIGVESTIIDFSGDVPALLRPGYIDIKKLRNLLGEVEIDPVILGVLPSGEKPKAPGMKYRHYAPKGQMCIVRGEQKAVVKRINELVKKSEAQGSKTGIIACDETASFYETGVVRNAGALSDEESIARHIYSILREFDSLGIEFIYSEEFDTPTLGMAIMNRLLKAAGHNIIEV